MLIRRILLIASLTALAAGCGKPIWPTTSTNPVPVLDHPDFDATVARENVSRSTGLRLAFFGDQRALADGEYQALVRSIAAREATLEGAPPLVGIIDTGDIVDNGKHTDQFTMLREILGPVRQWPYLVAVGNHELDQDLNDEGRRHYVEFMGNAPGQFFAPRRLWYRKDAPGLRVLFLDSNEWVYGPSEDQSTTRTEQLAWLSAQMAEDYDGRTIVVMHHPIIISNKKHRTEAERMWGIRWANEILADMFVRGGVDILVVGHTHTYERFRLTPAEGESFQLVNLSGRPRSSFMGFGASARRAEDISGRENEFLIRVGWPKTQINQWKIEQLDAMTDADTEADQWGELTLHPDGTLEMEIFYLVDRGDGGYRSGGKFTID